jgi:hypothetical protein
MHPAVSGAGRALPGDALIFRQHLGKGTHRQHRFHRNNGFLRQIKCHANYGPAVKKSSRFVVFGPKPTIAKVICRESSPI